MGNPADREGNFRCEILEYGIEESKGAGSQAVMVPLKAKLTAIYEPPHEGESEGTWFPWSEYDQEAYGRICVVKKDGSINTTGCESLINNAGWDGDFSALDNKTWEPKPCQVRLESEEYNGKTSFKIAYVNNYNSVPGGTLTSVGPEKAKALSARYGSALRAIKGTASLNAMPAPAGKPPAPKSPVASNSAPIPADEVPF